MRVSAGASCWKLISKAKMQQGGSERAFRLLEDNGGFAIFIICLGCGVVGSVFEGWLIRFVCADGVRGGASGDGVSWI